MIKLNDIIAANNLLVSLGGEDQMPRLAATGIEKSIELQSRIDRALSYADQAPMNSSHARNMARILDGSITIDDELNELPELEAPQRKPSSKAGKKKPATLAGRSTKERLKVREWIKEQGFDIAPFGKIPERYIEQYDAAQEALRRHRAQSFASRAAATQSAPPAQEDDSMEGQLDISA